MLSGDSASGYLSLAACRKYFYSLLHLIPPYPNTNSSRGKQKLSVSNTQQAEAAAAAAQRIQVPQHVVCHSSLHTVQRNHDRLRILVSLYLSSICLSTLSGAAGKDHTPTPISMLGYLITNPSVATSTSMHHISLLQLKPCPRMYAGSPSAYMQASRAGYRPDKCPRRRRLTR